MSGDCLLVLGWRERVDLPELGIRRLRAKVDSGARSSCLLVETHWRFIEGGAPWIGFRLCRGRSGILLECAAALVDERPVVDSGGHRSLRPFIRTRLELAGVAREVEINLADRSGMQFPMLLGRSAMQGAFTIDPSRSWLHNRRRAPR